MMDDTFLKEATYILYVHTVTFTVKICPKVIYNGDNAIMS